MQEHLRRFGESSRFFDNEEERYEMGKDIEELVAYHHGSYSEALKIDGDGRISMKARLNDASSPYLPGMIWHTSGTSSGPSLEDFYQYLKELGSILPSYSIAVVEDENRTSLTYTISAK